MKKKAARTVAIACRVFPHEEVALDKAADSMEMSRAKYLNLIFSINHYGTDLGQLQERLIEKTAQVENLQQQVESEKQVAWKQEPYATLLRKVLHNEHILEALHTTYGSRLVPFNALREKSYDAAVFLEGKQLEDKMFRFTGRYGWAYADKTRTQVLIKKLP